MTSMTARPRGTTFACEKRPATGSRGMVVTNHPLASAAGSEMLLGGGTAVDAAVAALFALTVVEPMMVGILGGGLSHLRLPDGRHIVIDNLSTAPAAAHAGMYEPTHDGFASARDTRDRKNAVGAAAVATPARSPAGCTCWSATARGRCIRCSRLRSASPRAASSATNYLHECTRNMAADLARDPGLAALFLPGGAAIAAGATLVQHDYAMTLRRIADDGPAAFHGGVLGQRVADHIGAHGGTLSLHDLASYKPLEREAIRGTYRGRTIVGPPPPASSGVHIAQMLNILEGFDVGAMGFGTPDGDPSAGRGAEDRFRGPRRRDRRSGLRRCAGRAPDFEGLCGRTPRANPTWTAHSAGRPGSSA